MHCVILFLTIPKTTRVCMYVCMYELYIWMYVCMYGYMYVYICIDVCMYFDVMLSQHYDSML